MKRKIFLRLIGTSESITVRAMGLHEGSVEETEGALKEGSSNIAMNVVDIFGNDTTKEIEVNIT